VRIATWNVNSIKARLPNVLEWLAEARPDVVLLQEIKTVDEQFPRLEIEDLGYNVAVAGQKTYNGVAILSKLPIEVEHRALPGDPHDEQARYIEAFTGDAKGGIRVASLYVPNGNPTGTDKFTYKLKWLERLHRHVRALLKTEEAFVLGGDYNVAIEDIDVYDPEGWAADALCHPDSRAALRKVLHLGLTDVFRALHPEAGRYTWWDYRAGAWQRDEGLRIDYLFLSPQAADRLVASGIDKGPRGQEKASDHTPVWCELGE
jgi:exodeoxyribonuclease-3